MKKIFKYLAMAVLGMAFALPAAHSAEAAKLAVIPLIMNSGVEDPQGLKPIVYSEAVSKIFKYPAYDLADSDVVKKAALAQQDKLFTKEGLSAVCDAAGAEIALAMSVDNFTWEEARQTSNSPTTICDFRGKFATYNKITGKFKLDHWYDNEEFETGALSPRYDWAHNELGRYFRILLRDVAGK
jgi:hypothetical protein